MLAFAPDCNEFKCIYNAGKGLFWRYKLLLLPSATGIQVIISPPFILPMKATNTLRIFFSLSLLLTGFFSGIGFVNAVGLIPAMEGTPVQYWAPYWQVLDYYMRARMPLLGMAMLVSYVIVIVLLARQKPFARLPLWCVLASLLMVFADLFIAFTQNLPVNQLLEKLDTENVPASFEVQKLKAAQAFYLRSVTMILSSVFMLFAYFWFETARDARGAGTPVDLTTSAASGR